MSENNVIGLAGREAGNDPLTELLRAGAERLIYQAVEAELETLLAEHADRRTEDGKAGVVRNGHLPARKLQTALGPVTFRSALVPPYVRKTRSLEAALPWLYLKGVSSGEMTEALKVLVGPDTEGLSASTVSRLKQVWGQEYRAPGAKIAGTGTAGSMCGPTVCTAAFAPSKPSCVLWW
ncbi:hypothetical protein BW247_11995 [Acidihalobacter ferrooxydans]|uniref:Mutator family transposase n=1 Tax=Acidihalobacter ferrooxydans TaxID=1765967 RepID=A0A1P8UIR8_9GAMM|nr:hypothetical protein BW247_11995 [Acidihalobacter ferrooxydans]